MLRLFAAISLLISTAHPQLHFELGKISPLLHKQALSHLAFHSNHLKLHLASMFASRSIAIVGVEWGEDVQLFAQRGYHVYAFEPASKFISHLQTLTEANNWNVTLIPAAASDTSERHIDIEYEDIKERVPTKRVDDVVSERLSVLSVDVQGDELGVLKGSTRILKDELVDSLWIEAIACNKKVKTILEMLDDNYVVFDFVPWGKHVANKEDVPKALENFMFKPGRPSGFEEYLTWMCSVQKERYDWLQTDFLMVRRELITNELLQSLMEIGVKECGNDQNDCVLRSLLNQHDEL